MKPVKSETLVALPPPASDQATQTGSPQNPNKKQEISNLIEESTLTDAPQPIMVTHPKQEERMQTLEAELQKALAVIEVCAQVQSYILQLRMPWPFVRFHLRRQCRMRYHSLGPV